MILKNNKGCEKEFRLVLQIKLKNKTYLIYEDPLTNRIYGGIKEDNILKKLNDDELELVNNLVLRIEG